MKVLHVNSYYSYYGEPGFYKNLFERQLNQGIDISVYVPTDHDIESASEKFGEYSKVIKTHNSMDRYIFYIKQGKMLKEAKKQYDLNEYDLIHAHSLFTNGYVAYKLNKEYGVPYIVAVRDTDVNVFFKKMFYLKNLGITIMKNASKIIFLSETYRLTTIEKYVPPKYQNEIQDKSEVITNGIDSFWLNNQNESKKNIDERIINILFIGHISKRKNVSITVEACKVLKERGYLPKFTIVGPIESNDEFNKIKDYDFVEYVEPQSKENLLNFYRLNDVFVMPSITETFGLVYAEAMSQGLPVLYTRGQGFDQQFKEGTVGFHVDCYNAKEIAERIIDVKNKYQEISSNCVKNSMKFNWNNISNEYLNLYNDISLKMIVNK